MSIKKDIIEAEFRTTGANKLHNDIGKTEGEIKRLNKENEMLMVNKKKLEAQNKKGTKAWKELNDQMKKNKQTILQEKKNLEELNSKLKVTEMSARQLSKRKQELTRELNNTSKAINPKKWNSLNKELKKVDTQYQKVRVGGAGVSSGMKKLGALLPVAGFAALAAGAKKLFSNMIEVRKEFEKYEAMLKVALGSQEAARKEMKMLQDFAAETPFQLEELTGAYVKLVNQGLKPTEDELTNMGDLSAAMGKDFDQLTEAIIDAQTGEFERLKEFGIRASKEGDNVKFTFKGIETQVAFTADSIKDYIVGLGETEGITGSMAEISGTLGGRISNLKDSWDNFLNSLGAKSSGILVNIINWTIDLINNLTMVSKSLKEIKQDVMDDLVKSNLEGALAEIDLVAKRMIERGVDQADAEKKAAEMHIESLEFRIREQKKALDQATEDEREHQQRKYDLLVGERDALQDHFFQVAQMEKKQQEAYLATYNEDQQKKREARIENEEIAQEEAINMLKKQRLEEEITEQQYNQRLLDLKVQHLQRVRDIMEQGGQDTVDINGQIIDLQIQQMNLSAKEQQRLNDETAQEKADAMKDYLQQMDEMYNEELLGYKNQLMNKEISQEEYEELMLNLKIEYMNLELIFRRQAGEETMALQNQIADAELQLLERNKTAMDQDKKTRQKDHKEMFKSMQNDIRAYSDSINSFLDSRRAAVATAKSMYEEDVANLKESLNNGEISYGEYNEQLAKLNEERLTAEQEAQKEFQRNMLLMLLDQLRNFLYVKIAEIWANEIASKSYWGLITAAALTVAVEGAYSLAKSKISAGGSYYAGGPTGLGGKYDPAGVVHKNEYVIPEEGFFNPDLRPFINVIEEARQAGTLRSLTMTSMPAGYQSSGSAPGMQGFAEGGPTSSMGEGAAPATDPQLVMLLATNTQLLQKLIRDGVTAYIGDKQVRELKERTETIQGIQDSVTG